MKCDHLVNFYILLEERKELRHVCNSMTNLHKIWQVMQNVSL